MLTVSALQTTGQPVHHEKGGCACQQKSVCGAPPCRLAILRVMRYHVCMQVRSAAEEYHAEFAAKEATIATLTAEAESARSHMQAEIDKLRSDMEVGGRFLWAMCLTIVQAHQHGCLLTLHETGFAEIYCLQSAPHLCTDGERAAAARAKFFEQSMLSPSQAEVASVKAAMQRRVEEAVAETEAKAAGLRDAREKNVHFSARVVALNARVAAQQKDLRALTTINASLTQELEELRAHRAARPAEPGPAENGGALCIFPPGILLLFGAQWQSRLQKSGIVCKCRLL